MKRALKLVAAVAILGIVAAACGGGGGGGAASPTGGASPGNVQPGGTLRMGMLGDVSAAFDPQKEYYGVTWEYYRCCLLRTLVSYNGKPTDEQGITLFPDLATDLPTVSADGLTWTFTLKPGLHYAPPMQDTEITSGDIVRAVEREACAKCTVGGYPFYYSVIKGFDDYSAGKADSISGLATPYDHTLVITLTEPAGDLGYRFAMAAMAPIPPNGKKTLGVADGHDKDYGRFLVASGPYMFQGSENLDFSVPAAQQKAAAGYVPGRSIVLVRNPSWDASTDDLRPAYPDEIQVAIGGNNDDLYNKIKAGELDYVVDGIPPAEVVRAYQTTPDLQPYIKVFNSGFMRYISFNLATPPFDDIHVRKAVSYAIDKAGMRQFRGGPTFGDIATHIIPDTLESNALKTYDPYATPNSAGDLDKAKAEMAQSKYDTNQDGVCDDPSCKDILSITDEADPYPKQAALIRQVLEPLGITLDVKQLERTTMYAKCNDINAKSAFCLGPAWGQDYADAFTFELPLFDSSSIYPSCCNYSLVGASAEQLKKAGYSVTSVPGVDDKVSECGKAVGDARPQCAANLDKYMMESIVPWVPYLVDNNVDILSANITNYSFDQFGGLAAFDQMGLKS